jgi:hypothetical protein
VLRRSYEPTLGAPALERTGAHLPARAPARGWVARQLPLAVLTGCAILLWAISIPQIDLSGMNDLGLVSVLPASFFAGLALLTISFCISLRGLPATKPLVFANIVVLVFVLYGLPALVEHEPRLTAAFRHIGVTESIARTESVDPLIDAYFNWPGFFIFSAVFKDLAGIDDLSPLVAWAPVFFNLLYLAPLIVLLRAARSHESVVWLGAWFFYLTNWIGQDYFSPQAMAFLLYLVVLGILLRWFQAPSPRPTYGRASAGRNRTLRRLRARLRRWEAGVARKELADLSAAWPSPVARAGLMGIAIVASAAAVASHQLTPFAILLAVSCLVVARRCPARRLPVLIAVLIGTWMSFVAVAYLRGHFETLLSNVGQVSESVGANVGSRVGGSAAHELIVRLRLVMTGVVWFLALAGAVREFKRGRPRLAFAVLAAAPIGLVAMQPYGGEVLLRAYLFGLPFVAYFVASLFVPGGEGRGSWMRTAALGVVSFGLLVALPFTRYGNERMDYFLPGEVAAVEHAYKVAPPGSLLVAGAPSVPWKFQDYEAYDYELLTQLDAWLRFDPERQRARTLAIAAERHLARNRRNTFVIITRSEKAQLELLGYPPGLLDELGRELSRSPDFALVYRNPDGSVWRLRARGRGTA